MAKLIRKLKSLDGVDEKYKDLYEKEGEYFIAQLVLDDGETVENVSALKSARDEERDAARELRAKLARFDGIGDPTVAKEALRKVKEMGAWSPDQATREAIEEARRQAREAEIEARKPLETRVTKLTTYVDENLRKDKALAALAKHKARNAKVLLPHVMDRLALKEEDDGYRVIVVKDGKRQYTRRSGQDGDMSVEELVETMKVEDDYKDMFEADDTSGGGSNGGEGGGGSRKTGQGKIDYDGGVIELGDEAEDIATGKILIN